jgi:hypothetical protein
VNSTYFVKSFLADGWGDAQTVWIYRADDARMQSP